MAGSAAGFNATLATAHCRGDLRSPARYTFAEWAGNAAWRANTVRPYRYKGSVVENAGEGDSVAENGRNEIIIWAAHVTA